MAGAPRAADGVVVAAARRPARRHTRRAKVVVLVLSSLLGVALLETFLRVADPLHVRLHGDGIILPPNIVYRFRNTSIPQIAPTVLHTKNSLGFRGPAPPLSFERSLTIVAVGGSTTECLYLSDGQDWPSALARHLSGNLRDLWINNAGLSGHSTYGHLVLLRDTVRFLRPRVVLFMIGANDVGHTAPRTIEREVVGGATSWREWMRQAAARSGIGTYLLNTYRVLRARERDLTDGQALNVRALPHALETEREPGRRDRLLREDALPLANYRTRVRQMVEMSRAASIEPVLITQPELWGPARDDVTGVDLATVALGDRRTGGASWERLELYNDVVRELGRQHDVLVIDVAREMRKSSRFFYDTYHFTDAGALEVARLISAPLCTFLARKFPAFVQRACG